MHSPFYPTFHSVLLTTLPPSTKTQLPHLASENFRPAPPSPLKRAATLHMSLSRIILERVDVVEEVREAAGVDDEEEYEADDEDEEVRLGLVTKNDVLPAVAPVLVPSLLIFTNDLGPQPRFSFPPCTSPRSKSFNPT